MTDDNASPFDDAIIEVIKSPQPGEGFNLSLLKPGTSIIIETRNSIYDIVFLEDDLITIFGGLAPQGNTRFPKPTRARFQGSTWGGSAIKLDWIGHNMRLELFVEETARIFTSSSVLNATIVAPDRSWSYTFDWEN